MQWSTGGLRIGSRILTNSGNGTIYFTAGNDSVKAELGADGHLRINDGDLVIETAGHGINFHPHSGTSNLLSDYEYGSWTPSFNALSTGNCTTNYAKYVKVGHLVHVTFYVSISSGSTNHFEMSMPFTNSNNASWNPITLQRSASSVDICIGRVQENSTSLKVITAVGDSPLTYANLNGQWVIAAGTYMTET